MKSSQDLLLPVMLASALALACDSPTAPDRDWSWIHVDAGTDGHTILDAAYGNGTFVIVGLGGVVATSPDGRTWVRRDGGFDSVVTGLTFDEGFGRFIAATHDDTGARRTIATSVDGASWTRVPTPRPEPMREVACGGGVCVAVGDEGGVLRSTDLLHWEDVSFTAGGFRWISVIHDGARFVVTGGREQVASSRDGRAWSVRSLGVSATLDPACTLGPECNDVDDVSFTGDRYVAVTHPTLGVWLSEDLETWTERPTGLPILDQPRRGLWATLSASGVTLVGGGGGKLAISHDGGESWQPLDAGFGADGIWAIAYGNGRFLVGGDYGRLATARAPS